VREIGSWLKVGKISRGGERSLVFSKGGGASLCGTRKGTLATVAWRENLDLGFSMVAQNFSVSKFPFLLCILKTPIYRQKCC
jgi:hypothetical protein